MSKQSNIAPGGAPSDAALLALSIDASATEPAYIQIYAGIRDLILSGRIAQGARLPASRALAAELGVARATAVAAYDQLAGEGYIEGRRGSGMYVAPFLPEHLMLVRPAAGTRWSGGAGGAAAPAELRGTRPIVPFRIGPDPRLFPHADWARLLQESWRDGGAPWDRMPDPFGHMRLRAAIADHLAAWRGIAATPDEIVVTAGTADALDIVIRTLMAPGETVWMEDPGHAPLRAAIEAHGLQPHAVPVDREGFDLDRATAGGGSARAVIVTPSRQFPLGHTMPLARRLAMIEWASQTGSWIVEDDYDSEFRYSGRPLAALASLDETGRVIYLGSFSKIFSFSLRLGFIVAPRTLADAFRRTLERFGMRASLVAQPALAAFMETGRFARHLRRLRRTYQKRQAALMTALAEEFDGLLAAEPQGAGMHLTVDIDPALRRRMDDREISARAREAGIEVPALSASFHGPASRQGLLMGFAAFDEDELRHGAHRLKAALW